MYLRKNIFFFSFCFLLMPHMVGSEHASLSNSCETQPNLFEQLDENIGEAEGIYDEGWARRAGALINNYQCEDQVEVNLIIAMINRKLCDLSDKSLNSADLRNITFTPTAEIREFIAREEARPKRIDELSGFPIIDTTHMDEVFRHMGLSFIPRSVALAIIENSVVPKEEKYYYPEDTIMLVETGIRFKPEITLEGRLRLSYSASCLAKELASRD